MEGKWNIRAFLIFPKEEAIDIKDIQIFTQDDRSHIPEGTKIVVYNVAIKDDHPEIIDAKKKIYKIDDSHRIIKRDYKR